LNATTRQKQTSSLKTRQGRDPAGFEGKDKRRKTEMTRDDKKKLEKELVLFELGKEVYGVDISVVIEIIRMQPITKVPKAPFFVEGVINLRGKVIPIVDMRKRFGLPKAEQNKDNRIMVLDSGGQNIGIIIDAVTEVLRIPSDSVEPPSNIIVSAASDYLLGIAKHDKNMIILLDMERVLSKDGVNAAVSLAKEAEPTERKKIEEMAVI
jgi:purine-binding chemotaxis protein CheW